MFVFKWPSGHKRAEHLAPKADIIASEARERKIRYQFSRAGSLAAGIAPGKRAEQSGYPARVCAHLPQVAQREALVPFGKALSFVIQKQRHMRISGSTIAQELEKSNLSRC